MAEGAQWTDSAPVRTTPVVAQQPAHELEVLAVLSRLAQEVDRAEQQRRSLCERLSAVSHPPDGQLQEVPAARSWGAPLANEIEDFVQRVSHVADSLSEQVERLEI